MLISQLSDSRKILIRLSSFLFVGLCLFGCSSSLDDLKERTDRDMQDFRLIQAGHTASIEELQSQIRALSGTVEELSYLAQGKTRELEQRLRRFSTRVPPPAGVPEKLLTADERKISQNSGPAVLQYKEGLQFIRAGDFTRAKAVFQNFSELNPDTTFTDNALFWVGISHQQLGEYDRAIVAFSQVFQRYPAEDRVPAALYYLGETFFRIDAKPDARLSFQKLVDEHPNSEFARRAKKKLAVLKGVRKRR